MWKGIVATISVLVLLIWAGEEYKAQNPAPEMAGSTVKLKTDKGHGSAVHIGGGFFVTAEHVTDGAKELSIKTDKGATQAATVLWSNDEYDLSLIKVEDASRIISANLECRVPLKGEAVQLRGNPLSQEHITTRGHIAGAQTKFASWKEAVPLDASIAGGMSGGGVFDEDGDLVGTIVGGMLQSFGFSSSPVGLGVIVPASTVCKLLART